MLSCFLFKKKNKTKKIAKGLDRTVLATGSCSPIPVLGFTELPHMPGSLCLKNQFSSRFPIFTVRPPGSVRFWELWADEQLSFVKILNPFAKFSIKPKLDEKNPFHPLIHNSKFAFKKTINGFGICVWT